MNWVLISIVFFLFKKSKVAGHKNCVCLVDSAINYCGEGVYEVLLLMKHCAGSVYKLMNEKIREPSHLASDLAGYFDETKVLKIFCDVCEAVAKLHQCSQPIIHRDLKAIIIFFKFNLKQ